MDSEQGGARIEWDKLKSQFWDDLDSGWWEGSYSVGIGRLKLAITEIVAIIQRSLSAYLSNSSQKTPNSGIAVVLWKSGEYTHFISRDSGLTGEFGGLLGQVSKTFRIPICSFETTGHDLKIWRSQLIAGGGVLDRFSICPEAEVQPSHLAEEEEYFDRLTLDDLKQIEGLDEAYDTWRKATQELRQDERDAKVFWQHTRHYAERVAQFFEIDSQVVLAHLEQFTEKALAGTPAVSFRSKRWQPELAPHVDDWFSRGHPFGWMELLRHAGVIDVDCIPGVWAICIGSSVSEQELLRHGISSAIRITA